MHVESTILTVMWKNSRICSRRPLLNLGICIVLIQGIRSFVIHPCMRLLFARTMWFVLFLHAVFPEFKGPPEFYDCSYARGSTSSDSRLVLGPEPRGETNLSRRGSLWRVRQDVGEKLAFPQQLSEKVHVGTWTGGCQNLNIGISQVLELEGRCALVGFRPRTPCVTPVLPGPGSDTRMKIGWKILTGTEKSAVWFFPECRKYMGEGTLSVMVFHAVSCAPLLIRVWCMGLDFVE